MCNNLTKEQALATAARYGLQREVADRIKKGDTPEEALSEYDIL